MSYPLIICFNLEQIRVSTRINEYQLQLSVVLFPYQEPVRIDVTLPATLVFPLQFMGTVLLGECSLLLQDVKHRREVLNVQTTTGTEFQRASELAGIDYLVHRSAQYLLDEVFRVLSVKDISLANVLQSLLNAAPALAMYLPAHFLRQAAKQAHVAAWQREHDVF